MGHFKTGILIVSCLLFTCYEAEKLKTRGLRQKDVEYMEKVRLEVFIVLFLSLFFLQNMIFKEPDNFM